MSLARMVFVSPWLDVMPTTTVHRMNGADPPRTSMSVPVCHTNQKAKAVADLSLYSLRKDARQALLVPTRIGRYRTYRGSAQAPVEAMRIVKQTNIVQATTYVVAMAPALRSPIARNQVMTTLAPCASAARPVNLA